MNLDFKRILCPVDMSEFSLDALRLAVKLAECSDATLDILHVIHNPFDELYMTAIAETNPALLDAYASEPQKRAKILRATEEHSEVLLKQFCHDWVKHHSKSALPRAQRRSFRTDSRRRPEFPDRSDRVGDSWPHRHQAPGDRQRRREGGASRAVPGADGQSKSAK